MVDLGKYVSKKLNIGKITPEEYATHLYIEEVQLDQKHISKAFKIYLPALRVPFQFLKVLHTISGNFQQNKSLTIKKIVTE